MAINSPSKIGRYEIQGELGRGAMGVVYKALDPNIGRTVALKTMRLDVHGADEEEILKRFKHEAKLAGVLNHPNVVTIYDAGEDQSIFYIAMEFVEGVTLQTLLHQQRVIPAQLMLEVTKQICPAMDFAHKRGIIHRDIKPANIMLTSSGGAKIMDFGIAKAEGGLTSAGQVLGTPAYMSPEQVRGKTLDGRSDLFSYGVCLYEMVTGEKPFTGQNVTTIIYKIMNEQPVPPRELDITIHPGLSEVITKALSKNPDERYQSGKELSQALDTYKDFGSNAEKTQVLSSMAAETAAMPAAQDTRATTSSGGILKKVRQTATLIGQGASGKGSHAAIESTVNVQQKAAAQSYKILDPRKIAIMVVALAVVVFGSALLVKKSKAKDDLQKTAIAAPTQSSPSGTQPAASTSSSPTETPAAAVTEEKKEEKKDAGLIAPDTVTKPAETAKKPPAAKTLAVKKPAATSAVTVPPPPAPEFGSIHVTSTPPGAQVTIDGKSETEWITPFTANKLSPGDHDIAFARQGFSSQKRHTTVAAGKTAVVNAELVAAIARINIKSTPTGANILL
jgi:serine/threonine protein kinase